ncbi:MAG: porin family protein [Alphaproteobacteria bacterium]|nr:MAG: porin family protein [Alphaproteobacteria bacterium]
MRLFATVGAAVLSLVAGAAVAADLPAKIYTKAPPLAPIYDWSGFYIGLNAGAASSHKCWTIFSNAGLAVAPAAEGCHDATGGLAGGQLGYRWQFASWVFGLEAQGDWAGLKGSNANQAVLIPATNATRIDAIGLFTGHIGYAWNNVLWYVKGGAAVTNDRYSTFFTATNVTYNEARESRWGGVVGTGIEFGFAPNWSVALEYDHLFMGSKDVTFPVSALAVTRSDHIRQDVDMGTVRVNYRFGGPVLAKY